MYKYMHILKYLYIYCIYINEYKYKYTRPPKLKVPTYVVCIQRCTRDSGHVCMYVAMKSSDIGLFCFSVLEETAQEYTVR